jgi:5-methylcytosine-specific restriction endonuclease McrA
MKKTPLARGNKQLKRSGFKRPNFDEIKQKQAKRAVRAKNTGNRAKRAKLPTLKKLRDQCDKLLTPIIIKSHPKCMFCPNPTQVAHHHIKKSTSNSLRYYIKNLINLCHKCHFRLHNDEILWTGRVIQNKGLAWLDDLEEKKREYVKVDRFWYMENYEKLKQYL